VVRGEAAEGVQALREAAGRWRRGGRTQGGSAVAVAEVVVGVVGVVGAVIAVVVGTVSRLAGATQRRRRPGSRTEAAADALVRLSSAARICLSHGGGEAVPLGRVEGFFAGAAVERRAACSVRRAGRGQTGR
jgi:hypothetical protein